LRDPEKIVLGKEIRIKVECPSTKFPEDVARPKVELLVLTLVQANWEQPSILNSPSCRLYEPEANSSVSRKSSPTPSSTWLPKEGCSTP